MAQQRPPMALLGFDIGSIQTRVSVFNISGGKYHLAGSELGSTSLGYGMHLGAGTVTAMQSLQQRLNTRLIKKTGQLILPVNDIGQGVDQLGMVVSAGPRVRTALLGLTETGSLAAGRRLAESASIELMRTFGLMDLADESSVVDALLKMRPELIILTGGSDAGTLQPLEGWVEILRLVCSLLPSEVKPPIIFAGNPLLEESARRRLEPVTALHLLPNLQPIYGENDLVPAQAFVDSEIMSIWRRKITGLADLSNLSNQLDSTKSFAFGRTVRYLSRSTYLTANRPDTHGVMAVDLGGGSTTLAAGINGAGGTVDLPRYDSTLSFLEDDALINEIHQWTMASVSPERIQAYLGQGALQPIVVPGAVDELAIEQAFARVRLQRIVKRFAENYGWINYDSIRGMDGHFEPIIASGAVLTQAPSLGQAMMILLDGLQPRGITTVVLDQHHLLSILGVLGEVNPVLPVHVLASGAFLNLGTVITPVRDKPGQPLNLEVQVSIQGGKDYDMSIEPGLLKRVIIPTGAQAILELKPGHSTDVGFGEPGKGGRLKVAGGALGVVIDARGRPLRLPADDPTRVAQLEKWLWSIDG